MNLSIPTIDNANNMNFDATLMYSATEIMRLLGHLAKMNWTMFEVCVRSIMAHMTGV